MPVRPNSATWIERAAAEWRIGWITENKPIRGDVRYCCDRCGDSKGTIVKRGGFHFHAGKCP